MNPHRIAVAGITVLVGPAGHTDKQAVLALHDFEVVHRDGANLHAGKAQKVALRLDGPHRDFHIQRPLGKRGGNTHFHRLVHAYGREGASIIADNCQLTIYGGFAPGCELAEKLSKSLGDTTVQSGYISKGKGDGSRTFQMTGRPLISPDELKALPKGRFIVTKTGCHPIQATLWLFTEWGITFADEWRMPEQEPRPVAYVDRVAQPPWLCGKG